MLRDLNNSEHSNLAHVYDMCAMLSYIRSEQYEIVVLPDFDCDGVMSAVVLYVGLSELGFKVHLFTPNPACGYGFGEEEAQRLCREYPDAYAVITCDTGINEYEGVSVLKDAGFKVLITDHHVENPKTSARSVADCVVDPCGIDDPYITKGICGAHVAWQILMVFAGRYCSRHDADQIDRLRVFAGIGTISDMMPLVRENRRVVSDAISISRMIWSCGCTWFVDQIGGCPAYREAFRGLYAAIKVFLDNNRYLNGSEDIDEDFFGFYLAPMINAVKRRYGDMSKCYGMFLSSDHDACAAYCYDQNVLRKEDVAEGRRALEEQLNPYEPFVYISEAAPGIVGLLANDRMLESGVPTLVVMENNDGTYSGSGRSPVWYEFLTRMRELGVDMFCEGHQGAFGVKFDSIDKLKAFVEVISKDVKFVALEQRLTDFHVKPEPDLVIALDGTGDVGVDVPLLAEFVLNIQSYRPFGKGFEAPRVLIRFGLDTFGVKYRKTGKNKQHLIFELPFGVEVCCWNQTDVFEGGNPPEVGDVSVLGELHINKYGDTERVQLTGDIVGVA